MSAANFGAFSGASGYCKRSCLESSERRVERNGVIEPIIFCASCLSFTGLAYLQMFAPLRIATALHATLDFGGAIAKSLSVAEELITRKKLRRRRCGQLVYNRFPCYFFGLSTVEPNRSSQRFINSFQLVKIIPSLARNCFTTGSENISASQARCWFEPVMCFSPSVIVDG